MSINISIAVLKRHSLTASTTDNQASQRHQKPVLPYLFDDRTGYLSNASLSLDCQKNTSTDHRSTYLSKISQVLGETFVLIKAHRAWGHGTHPLGSWPVRLHYQCHWGFLHAGRHNSSGYQLSKGWHLHLSSVNERQTHRPSTLCRRDTESSSSSVH